MEKPDNHERERRTDLAERVGSLELRMGTVEVEIKKLVSMPAAISSLESQIKNFDERFFGIPGTPVTGIAGDIQEIKEISKSTNGKVNRHETELAEVKATCAARHGSNNNHSNIEEKLTPFKKGGFLATGLLLLMGAGYAFWRFIQWIQTLQIGK
ncbi:MAG: hypothetical protein PHD09_03900 [Candidatus Omnitrophica bacterium]|jgi:hypothetical protein|nr:hypothetical protein [Candidatus Omnitrophota bacterium]